MNDSYVIVNVLVFKNLMMSRTYIDPVLEKHTFSEQDNQINNNIKDGNIEHSRVTRTYSIKN